LVADLRHADVIPSSTYDAIIVTQTLQLIDDMDSVVGECARILKPGGVLLATVPSVIRVDDEGGLDGDFWRLTEASARRLFSGAFPVDSFEVTSHGNVMTCAAFLYGISTEEMKRVDMDHVDPNFPLVIAVRAVKPAAPSPEPVTSTSKSHRGSGKAVILSYHRIAELVPDSHALCTPAARFREHMELVRSEFTPIPLDDLVRAAACGCIPERAVAVTLDDGYVDALTTASPILTELGIPATFFVNTERLDEEHERWWDILERVLNSDSSTLEELNRMGWPLDAAGRGRLVADALASRRLDVAVRPTHRVLTGDEIRTLDQRVGHRIGAHTTHHLALTAHPLDIKRNEVFENRDTLQRLLGRPVSLFAYPYGDVDGGLVDVVRRAGFLGAVTVEPNPVTAGTNRLLLPRYEAGRIDRNALAVQLHEIFEGRYVSMET
jgi:peptidoglycan/xylan/chitin deacetylase (PgdA/CDA1 family)